MIHQVIILQKNSGICLFARDYTRINIPEQMVSAALKTLNDLARQLSEQDLDSMKMGEWILFYVIGKMVSVILITDFDDDEKIIRGRITLVLRTFSEKYEKNLADFRGNVGEFEDFKEDCDDIFVKDWNFEFNQRIKGRTP